MKRPLDGLTDEVVVLLDNLSSNDEDVDKEICGEEEQRGIFSIFSTSLCNLEVSDVGAEVAIVEGREDGVLVSGPGTLGRVEKGKDN